jgi:parallel beta-helix repeat protein
MKKYITLFCLFSTTLFAQMDFEKKLQKQLILVEDGGTIEIPAGNFALTKSLSLEGKKNILIKGKGIDQTILSFKGQLQGAEGIKISNCENITLEDFTAEDSKGDLIKTMQVKGMNFRRLKTAWTGDPKSTNGSYALYPVLCENVLIENCIAIGASDAGIYVGQSKNIIVRNCEAYQNVAGIEIENSLNAEVEENNLKNFAPKGNIVGNVPKGTGMMILATSDVEIFDNIIKNNQTIGVAIISYFMTELKIKDKQYDPYPTGIYVHNNTFERKAGRAPADSRFGKLFRFKLRLGRNLPFVVYDGILNPEKVGKDGNYYPEYKICVIHNSNQKSAYLDAENDFKGKKVGNDLFNCELGMVKTTTF